MGNKVSSLFYKLKKPKDRFFHSKGINDDDDVFFTPKSVNTDSNEEDHQNPEIQEVLLSSDSETENTDSPIFVCEICIKRKTLSDSFNFKGCTHFYCTNCIVRYVASKLDDNFMNISCPVSDCQGVLDPDFCRYILPKGLFDRWGIALCESMIDGSQKFYCPYRDCSALLINDTGVEVEDTESTCPVCKRGFCVKCKVSWHSEIGCEKFQKLRKKGDDNLLIDLAKRKNWKRCPKCKFFVERSVGCFYMKCRCGYAFCYKCGARSSTTTHACPKCKY
ncbi:hypothetical protein JCGZ_07542 [Jatropha curcas]|uniref:RBR-type E3 ubiquitin transferase n=1 Tax=Jatropha curcas TaxID=180498 RepID=A0A067KCL7_JATCU|nr:probable E3 ubiquitin-protein ligase RNF217 [Jatropha curcas]KDP33971.1 hypothetical protein JCGZ_07542 [Jatropha curcas]